jgi:hypothetical protein
MGLAPEALEAAGQSLRLVALRSSYASRGYPASAFLMSAKVLLHVVPSLKWFAITSPSLTTRKRGVPLFLGNCSRMGRKCAGRPSTTAACDRHVTPRAPMPALANGFATATSIASGVEGPCGASAVPCRAARFDVAPERWKQPAQPNERQPVSRRKPWPRASLPSKHIQLMPQHRDLGFQLCLRPQRCGQCVKEQPEEVEHSAYASPSRCLIQSGRGSR